MYRIEQLYCRKYLLSKAKNHLWVCNSILVEKSTWKKCTNIDLKKKPTPYIAFQYTLFLAHEALEISKNIPVYILQALHSSILLDKHP